MFLTRLAFKNLIRHRNRTLITASIIAFAIFFYIFLDSMIGGMTELSYNSIIDYEAGHLQIMNNQYWEEKDEFPLDYLFTVNENLLNVVSDSTGYQASSPELDVLARLNNGTNEIPVVAKGIIPDRFEQVFNIDKKFVDGKMFSPGENKAVMGKKLAELLRLEKGDYIILLVKDKNGTFNTIEAEIYGLIHTANPAVNNNYVYLPLDTVQQALNVDKQVSKLIVRLENKYLAETVDQKIEEKLVSDRNLSVHTWSDLEAVSVAGAKQKGNQLVMVIILLIAAIAIINTVILAALERMEEIGMMKAMGLRVPEIIYTFVLESTGIGILGGIIGIILGSIGVWFLVNYGIDFTGLVGVDMSSFGIPVLGKFYGVWNPSAFIMVFSFGVIVSVIASILPAYWAASKDPVKAIYHRQGV